MLTSGGVPTKPSLASGWREIIRPALALGATLWPFDGDIRTLSDRGSLVLAETYPADAYAVLSAPFGWRESKTSQADRRSKASPILAWASAAGVDIGDARTLLLDGFGESRSGEDPFDALVGLLAMIAIVDGSRPEATVSVPSGVAVWEGWILGR